MNDAPLNPKSPTPKNPLTYQTPNSLPLRGRVRVGAYPYPGANKSDYRQR